MNKLASNEILVRPMPGNPNRAIIQAGHLTFRAALGRSSHTWRKREGDGATPIAAMRLLWILPRWAHKAIRTRLPMLPIRPSMLWCDASGNVAVAGQNPCSQP